jgi:2-keto-3-deoxy-L-rhamnonate aldolase RhmA
VTAFRPRLIAGEPLVGIVVRTPSHHVVEVLAASRSNRPDVVVLDAEHAPFDLVSLDVALAVAHALGFPALVRVPELSGPPIQQALDLGATGVVVPRVASPDDARRAVRLAHYGDGGRGFSPSTRSAGWGSRPMGEVLDDAAASTVVVVQVEDPAAVAAVGDIVAIPGVDAVLVGRADLAVALGRRSVDDPAVVEALDRVAAACSEAGVTLGVVTAAGDEPAAWHARGAGLVLAGTDQSRL